MKKSVSFLFLNLAAAATLAAAQTSSSSGIAQNIARFTGDPAGSSTLCPLPTQLVNHTVFNTGVWQVNWSSIAPLWLGSHTFPIHPSSDGPHSDPAACLADLKAFLGTLHLESISWQDIETWLNKLHLDPALISNLQMWVQNHQCNGGFNIQPGPTGSDSNSSVDLNSNGNVASTSSDESIQQDAAPFELPPDAGTVAVPEPGPIALVFSGGALLSGVLLRRRSR